ncbi:MAG: hypothetical protein AABO41_01680 [Acidobacteriota bacterium]
MLRHIVASHLAQTVHSQELFFKLTNELIRFAEQALVMRDVDALDEVSHILMSLPINAARQIGRYYYSRAIYGNGQRDEANGLLEKLADNGPITYRARAIQTLGANYHASGQLDEALRFQLEALRLESDRNGRGFQATMLARWEISTIRGLNGDHRGALSDLKDLRPLLNLAAKQQPFYFYAYCNDLAVELGELGRIAEAEAALEASLASPYASAYPNWAETRDEIAAKRVSATPSIVAVNRAPAPSRLAEPRRKSKPVGTLAFTWPRFKKTSVQRASRIAACATIPHDETTQTILERVLTCIGSRAPPLAADSNYQPMKS